ncbi:MAG: ABC transporter substrate-binding protein [Deltaproteobacteria bacterium]|nr:ABC transporter substrate-binding protein [Deltaproteobacteria bacterium]
MKKTTVSWTVLLGVCFVMAMSFPAWGAKTIKIGVIGPMNFVQGKGHWNGAVMAMEKINARGGIQVGNKKMKIKLVKADSNEFLNVMDATNAMELILTRDKVDFIVGGFRSEAVLAMQDIAMDYKKIFIGCGAAHPKLCLRVAGDYKRYKYFFRGTPFNSRYLVKTCFIQMATVGAILKKVLNIPKVKVAIVAEKAMWVDPMIKAAQGFIPKMGMEVVPAVQVGINVEAQKDGFWKATQGMGNYVMTLNTYCRDVEANVLTKPFVETYIKRFGEVPTYTADTYAAIVYNLAPAIEQAGTLDADKLIPIMETREYLSPGGTVGYLKDAEGRHLHDLKWGPGYLTSLGVQWQDGKLKGVWPNRWKASKDAPAITYKGIVPYKIPPWVIKKYKK